MLRPVLVSICALSAWLAGGALPASAQDSDRAVRAQLERARAAVQVAVVELEQLKRNLDRLAGLGRSPEEIKEAKARVVEAAARLEAARAQQQQLEARLGNGPAVLVQDEPARRLQEMEMVIRRLKEENEHLRAKMEELARHLRDRPADRQEVKLFSLRHAPAHHVCMLVRQLFDGESRIRCVADERLNALIVRGEARALDMIEALVSRLDQPMDRPFDKPKPDFKPEEKKPEKPVEDKKPE